MAIFELGMFLPLLQCYILTLVKIRYETSLRLSRCLFKKHSEVNFSMIFIYFQQNILLHFANQGLVP